MAWGLVAALALWLAPRASAEGWLPAPVQPADLFRLTNVWTVHLKFSAKAWAKMEPAGGGGGFMGGGGRGPGGGGGGMGPAMFLTRGFLRLGDQDHDGSLSRQEFAGLAGQWFGEWDKIKNGRLDSEELREGIRSTFMTGNGGPGGGGGRNLQGGEGTRNGLAAARGIEFEYVPADLEFGGRRFPDVAVRYKGNGTFIQSRGSLKRSLKIDLNKYIKGQKLAGITKLNLHNNVSDPSWMNEVLSHRLYRDAGVPGPRTSYARVYVTVAGLYDRKYFGLYSIVEDLDKNFAAEYFGGKVGAIFKPVTRELFAELGTNWAKYQQTYDPKTPLSSAEEARVMEFARFLGQASDAQFSARLGEYLDLEEFARFMAVTVWLSTLDSILGAGQNYYMRLDPTTRRFQFLPWDLDHSFGQFPLMGTQEMREQLSLAKPWQGERRFLERVFKVDAFQKLYRARLKEFSQTICRPERLARQVDEIAAAIRPAVREESPEKLTRLDKVAAGEEVEIIRANGPVRSGQMQVPIKPFARARAQSISDQLAGKSEGESPGMPGFGGGGRGMGRGGAGQGQGQMVAAAVMTALDANEDDFLTRDEFQRGFARWFDEWDANHDGFLSEEELRAGLSQLLPGAGGRMGVGAGVGRGWFR